MKAKTVNETQKFERSLDPKVAMNIGDITEQIKQQINDIVEKAYEQGVSYDDIDDILYNALHSDTSYSDEAYIKSLNMD
jgi:hypothetical protein